MLLGVYLPRRGRRPRSVQQVFTDKLPLQEKSCFNGLGRYSANSFLVNKLESSGDIVVEQFFTRRIHTGQTLNAGGGL